MQMDLAVGARIRFVFRNGEAPTLDGSITELDPPRVFAYTWGDDAWLRWEIRPEAEGCLLVFTHTFDDRPAAASFAFGWQTCLNAFEALLEEKPAAPADDYVTAHEAYVEEFGLLEGSSEQDADGSTVRFERNFPYPQELVWDALAGSDPPPAVSAPPPQPATAPNVAASAVTALTPGSLLEYAWAPSPGNGSAGHVRWELTSGPPGTRVSLSQHGRADTADTMPAALTAWRARFVDLADELRARWQATPVRL
jgi:uncharacterized protein YndB with AHSA1/START domain